MTYNSQGFLSFRGHEYFIVEVDGKGLFDPADIGIVADADPVTGHQGFSCAYTVENDRLVLNRFLIEFENLSHGDVVMRKGLIAFGQMPSLFFWDSKCSGANNVSEQLRRHWTCGHYDSLNQPIAFTGTLLLAARDAAVLDDELVEPETQYYDAFHELTFRKGKLVVVKECSSKLA